MKLGLIDYNRGQMPSTIKGALKICPIYSRKDIEEYLQQNAKGIHKVNAKGYIFGFCEKEYQSELQEMINNKE